MKTKLPWLILVGVALMAATAGTTLVTQTGEDFRSATNCQNGTGTAQQTLTFTAPPPGCFWVIDNLDNGSGATTAPAVTILTTTSTGFAANPKFYLTQPATATGISDHVTFANGLRASEGTAVTFVSNAAVTSINYMLNACGHLVCR